MESINDKCWQALHDASGHMRTIQKGLVEYEQWDMEAMEDLLEIVSQLRTRPAEAYECNENAIASLRAVEQGEKSEGVLDDFQYTLETLDPLNNIMFMADPEASLSAFNGIQEQWLAVLKGIYDWHFDAWKISRYKVIN